MPRPLPYRADPAPPPPDLLPGAGQAAHDAARAAQWRALLQTEDDVREPRARAQEWADRDLAALRRHIRGLIGPAGWVQAVWPCRVVSIDDTQRQRCTVLLLESGATVHNVRYDPGVPQLGGEYAVRRTVRLNPAAEQGAPELVEDCLKTPPGGRFLYGAEGMFDFGWATYRVPFPFPDSPDPDTNTPAGSTAIEPELVVPRTGYARQVQFLWADDFGHLYVDITEDTDPETLLTPEHIETYDVSAALPGTLTATSPDLVVLTDYDTQTLTFTDTDPPAPVITDVHHTGVRIDLTVAQIVGTAYPSPLWVATSSYPATASVTATPPTASPPTATVTHENRAAVWYSTDAGGHWTLWLLYVTQTLVAVYPDYVAFPGFFGTTLTQRADTPRAFGWVTAPAAGEPESTPGSLHLAEVHATRDPSTNAVAGYRGHVGTTTAGPGSEQVFPALPAVWSRRTGPLYRDDEADIVADPETRYLLTIPQPVAPQLYAQSVDGGTTWTTPDITGSDAAEGQLQAGPFWAHFAHTIGSTEGA